MRRYFLALGIVLLLSAKLFSAPLADDYAFLRDYTPFLAFVDAVRVQGDAPKAETLRMAIINNPLEDTIQQAVLSIRSATLLSRLYTEAEDPDEERARTLLDEAEAQLEHLQQYPYLHMMGQADIDSVHYLINPKRLGKGISSNAKIKKAYAQFPNQVYAILMKANSLLYAPSFAGGDKNEALLLLLGLLDDAESLLSPWDRASIYTGIGRIAMERKDWETALGYFQAAKAIYQYDPTLDSYIQETKEHL